MFRAAKNAFRALSWVIGNRQGWLLRWYARAKARALVMPLERRRRDGSSRPPLGVTLRVTMRCNLRCRMCHVIHSEDETAQRLREIRDIPLELAKNLIDQLGEIRTYCCFSGGEPLLYDNLPILIDQGRRRRIMTTISTNGTLLEERAQELVEAGLSVLSVSLLGPREVHNETVAVPDAFERLEHGVYAVEEAKQRRGTPLPVVVVNCPMTDLNAKRLVETAEVASDWPLAALHFQHMWFKPREALALQRSAHRGLLQETAFAEMGDANEADVDTEALAEQIEVLLHRRSKYPILIYPHLQRAAIHDYYLSPLSELGPRKAVCLWLFTMIYPNGEVSPCEGFTAGNLNEQRFMEIWNGEKLRAFRRKLQTCHSLPVCHRCCVFYRRH
ncbi:MAG: radical SAM/SPASM domain-containing protein [Candidatus Zipacnadales bacterium]